MMTPGLRKFALTAHVTSSVGWLGAVAGFLALAIAGLTSQEDHVMRGAYLGMELIAWSVIVPLSLASPFTGIVQSFGTTWGLFRHYWVLVKFLATIPATVVLLVHLQPIGRLAEAAAEASSFSGDLGGLRIQLVANAGAALLVLLVATALSVYKPRGMTPYGWRKHNEENDLVVPQLDRPPPSVDRGGGDRTAMRSDRPSTAATPAWARWSAIIVGLLVLVFVITHLAGGGLGRH